MILAGDVGGTKTLLGLFRRERGGLRQIRSAVYPSAQARSVLEPIRAFLADGRERPRACALGVAGPVERGRASRVHLPWTVDAASIRRATGIETVAVINDVEATAWGIPELGRKQVCDLTPRRPGREGTAAVLAVGTGLGTAALFHDGRRLRPAAAEGGHATWGPPDEDAAALRDALARVHGRVEVEHVLSGPGLVAVYDHVVAERGGRVPRATRVRMATAPDRAAAIAELALDRSDRAARVALERFARWLGSFAGDLALALGAVGGVWIAGGIPPKVLPSLTGGELLEAFERRGPLTGYLSRIPVRVVLEPRCALLGAAARALADAPGGTRAARARSENRSRRNEVNP